MMTWSSCGTIEGGARTDFGCVRVNNREVFIVGGKRHFEGLKNSDLFDLETKRWSKGPALPIEMGYCRAAIVNQYVYAVGSYKDFYRIRIDQFNLGWQRLPSLKVNGLGCEMISDKERYIYFIGDNDTRSSVYRYDTIKNKWQSLPMMKIGRDLARAIYIDGKIYVMGGRNGPTGERSIKSVEIFDTATKKWLRGPPIPRRMYGHSATAVDKYIMVSGGQRSYGSDSFSTSFIFDTHNEEWSLYESELPQGFSGHSSIAIGLDVIVMGGTGGSSQNKEMYMTTLNFNMLTKRTREESLCSSASSNRSLKSWCSSKSDKAPLRRRLSIFKA